MVTPRKSHSSTATPVFEYNYTNSVPPIISEDCAPGTCYEGACAGDNVYSTDGTCGIRANRLRMCAGKWGDCCNMDGVCGTGPDFCSMCVCSVGNCTRPNAVHAQPLFMAGNTTDGTCGGKDNITCNVIYGNCCSKDGICGEDCGEGWWVLSLFSYSQVLTDESRH